MSFCLYCHFEDAEKHREIRNKHPDVWIQTLGSFETNIGRFDFKHWDV